MKSKPIVLRPLAKRDASSAANYYAVEASLAVADRFTIALESAYRSIAQHPASGSPRYADEVQVVGLRMKALRRFPYLVFF